MVEGVAPFGVRGGVGVEVERGVVEICCVGGGPRFGVSCLMVFGIFVRRILFSVLF